MNSPSGKFLRSCVVVLLPCALLVSCSGGSSGGGGGGNDDLGFVLRDIKYGRQLDEGEGPKLVSPMTTVQTDPVTGLVIPGTLEALSPSIRMEALVSLGLGSGYVPRVVPRNCVLVLEFSETIDATSLVPDQVDPSGNVISSGNIRIRIQGTQNSVGVPVNLVVDGNRILMNPVVQGTVGFPPSPVNFSSDGEARASATGYLRMRIDTGDAGIRSVNGNSLSSRSDHLGEAGSPIGLNPGNVVLDFIAQDELIPTNETFNGFLPDNTEPRVVRRHEIGLTIDVNTDTITGTSITVPTDGTRLDNNGKAFQGFSDIARNGMGEWSGRLLTLRPQGPNTETRLVSVNTKITITVSEPFGVLPQDGDTFDLTRAEFFEPDPANPIDARLFDPNNPENGRNSQLANFLSAYEIDANMQPVRGPLDIRQPLPPNSEVRLSFNEPMNKSSMRPYESFMVSPNPPTVGSEKLSSVFFNAEQTEATLRPVRRDANGQYHLVGWGPGTQSLLFTLATVPQVGFLQENLSSPAAVQKFLDEGHQGATDLGGRPLAFPESQFDVNDPVYRFSEPFLSVDTEITADLSTATEFGDWGVVVHRFQGRPKTGIDPITGDAGVSFVDQPNLYSPIPDVNLAVNGFLAGPPVTFIRKVHDDFFPPIDGQFGAIPNGVLTPMGSFNPASSSNGRWTYDGMRFQHVFRDHDASPGTQLAGTLLDLFQVSWSPIGGNVTTDVYDDVSVHAAHSTYRPITRQNGAGASEPWTGLDRPFDFDTWYNSQFEFFNPTAPPPTGLWCDFTDSNKQINSANEGPNYYGDLATCVNPGTTYRIQQQKIFTILGSGNSWHPWPKFNNVFQYNNGDTPKGFNSMRQTINQELSNTNNKPWEESRKANKQNEGGDSLLMEYRLRPQTNLVSLQNGFTFSFGILITHLPRFRAWSAGEPTNRLFPDQMQCDIRARCADGPHFVNGNLRTFADNSRYFTVFDYVKTTATITAPFVGVIGTTNAAYHDAITEPPVVDQPGGTITTIEYQGANGVAGNNSRPYSSIPSDQDGKNYITFRVKFVGNTSTLLAPNFDSVAVPYRRP